MRMKHCIKKNSRLIDIVNSTGVISKITVIEGFITCLIKVAFDNGVKSHTLFNTFRLS